MLNVRRVLNKQSREDRRTPTTAPRVVVIALLALAGVLADGKPAAAYHLSTSNGNILLMQANADQYIQILEQFTPGYRVKYFNAEYFATFNDVVYSAVLEPNPESYGVSHQFDIPWGVLSDQLAMLQDVAEMMQVDSYEAADGEVRYAYIAYHKPDPAEWFAFADVNAGFVDQIEDGLPDKLKLVNRTSAGIQSNVTALYKADNTYTFTSDQDLLYDEFESWYAIYSQVGFRLTSLEVNNSQSTFPITYRPVFKSDGNLRFSTETIALDSGFDQAIRDQEDLTSMDASFVAMVDLGEAGPDGDFPAFFVGWRGQAKFNSKVLSGDFSETLATESDPIETFDPASTNLQKQSK